MIFEMKCKNCNEFISTKIDDDKYFKYLITGEPRELELPKELELMYYTQICNNCRLEGGVDGSK